MKGLQEIWKHQLKSRYKETVEMPKGAKILCIEWQYGKATLWMLVDPAEPLEERTIVSKETGAPFKSENHKYISTLLSRDGTYVLHFFEIIGD